MSELLLVSGKPGCGKSTASAKAAERISDARHLSMGDRLRAISRGDVESRYSAELSSAQDDLAHHKAVGRPELPVLVLEEFMGEQEGVVILDGFPRYRNRVGLFREMVKNTGTRVLAACRIEVANSVSLERLAERQQRSQSVVEDEDFYLRRINDYYDEVVPVMDAVRELTSTFFIDGHQAPEAVADDIIGVYHEVV